MGQQQIRVSFSVGTKLLISVVLLLLIVILFLNSSSILLFREDKKAYVYRSQSNEAVLAGREFLIMAKHAIDTLKIYLSAVDPRNPLTPQRGAVLQSIVNNQNEILTSSIYLLNTQTGDTQLYSAHSKEKEIKEIGFNPNDYIFPKEQIQSKISELLENTYCFVNLSSPKGIPVLGVIFADVNLKNNPSGMPVSVGLISLKGFGGELSNLKLTIANRAGWILYDSDPTSLFSGQNISADPLFKTAAESKLVNGAKEYNSDGVHYLGSYVLPGLDLVVLTKLEWQKAMRATYVLIEKFVLLGTMVIGISIILAILFSKTLTAPLGRLYEATKEVSQGNFNLQLKERGKDEITALAESFNVMSKRIGELVQESMDKVHLENEIAIASTVQQTLIPPEEFRNPWLHIYSHYQSASQCGGDWWGFFGVGDKVALMIADATGHGLPSALITASARSCFSVMHKLAQEDPEFSFSPSAMLSFANRVIFDAAFGKIMMTFFIGVVDFGSKTLSYSSAGHNPPWLFKKDGDRYSLNSLTAVGQRLGESRDAPPFEEKEISISPNDIIFLYTDGLTEGKDPNGTMFGKKRVRKLVEGSLSKGPESVIKDLMAEFLQHNANKPLDDDVTIATAMILSPEGQS